MIQQLQCEYEKAEFSHAGDLGDIIWGTAAIRLWIERSQMPQATLYLFDQPGLTTHAMTEERASLLIPLLSAQPWLRAVWSPVPVVSDLNGFRDHFRDAVTIAGFHLSALGLRDGAHTEAVERRWMELPAPAHTLSKRVEAVFVRTCRYKSHDFPWSKVVDWFGHSAVFLGHQHEYADFVRDHPQATNIPYIKTANLLEAAQMIDHADLFIGNQTALFAIAEALKKPRVLESFAALRNCEYGSRNCLAVHPQTKVTKERILELLDAPFTV